jgi:hypothetical protein
MQSFSVSIPSQKLIIRGVTSIIPFRQMSNDSGSLLLETENNIGFLVPRSEFSPCVEIRIQYFDFSDSTAELPDGYTILNYSASAL